MSLSTARATYLVQQPIHKLKPRVCSSSCLYNGNKLIIRRLLLCCTYTREKIILDPNGCSSNQVRSSRKRISTIRNTGHVLNREVKVRKKL